MREQRDLARRSYAAEHAARRSRTRYQLKEREPSRPSFAERRHGLVVTWDMDLRDRPETVRMVRVELLDPRLSALRDRRRDRIITRVRSFFGFEAERRPSDATHLLQGGAGVGGVLSVVMNALVGDPLSVFVALGVGGAAAAGALYATLFLRFSKRWRTITLQDDADRPPEQEAAQRAGVEVLLEAHGLAVSQTEALNPDPEDGDALRSVRWLMWELAAPDVHDRPEAFEGLRGAAEALRVQLAVRVESRLDDERHFTSELRRELEADELLEPGVAVDLVPIHRPRRLSRRERGNEAVRAAARYARDSADALAELQAASDSHRQSST